MVTALRIYYTSSQHIDLPDRKETRQDIELLISRRWTLYSLAIIFGIALLSSFLSIDHLSKSYGLTELQQDESAIPVQEIIPADQSILQSTSRKETLEEPKADENSSEEPVKLDEQSNNSENAAIPAPIEEEADEPETTNSAKTMYTSHEELTAQFPSFRGPYGLGISDRKNVPTEWDGTSGENVLWKVKIPLQGYNSPVIWGNQIFVTGADNSNQSVYCYDLNSGDLIWEHKVSGIQRTSTGELKPTEDTGYAAPTVATDGRYLFAIFATGDVVGLDMKGNRIWAKNLGIPDNHYGHSSSLLVWKSKVYIQFDTNKEGKIMALNAATGTTEWETARTSKISWASPILADLGDHKEIVLSSSPQVAAYDPDNGKELWSIDCLSGEIGPSAGFLDGIVFAANEYANLVAIKPGSPAKIIWESNEYLPEVASPVAKNGLLYIGTSYGVIACFDATNGEIVWEYECDQGFYASPVIADNKIYFMDMDGIMHIFATDKTRKVIGEPELGERSVSTPAFVDGKIIIRGYDHLFCIGG